MMSGLSMESSNIYYAATHVLEACKMRDMT